MSPSDAALGEMTWPNLIWELLQGQDLSAQETSWVMNEVMSGSASPVSLAGFLVALAAKGETVSELLGLADTMVAHAVDVPLPRGQNDEVIPTVDVVGTRSEERRVGRE